MKAKINPIVAAVVILLVLGLVGWVWFQWTRTSPLPRSPQEIQGIGALESSMLKSAEEHQKKSKGPAQSSQSVGEEEPGAAQDAKSSSGKKSGTQGTSVP
jgi:hypothetical protein